jgi:chemotaxis protein MotA
MDSSTIIGLLLGCVILTAALILGQVPIQALICPEALLIVFGGTMTSTLISFSMPTLMGTWRSLGLCFKQDTVTNRDCVDTLTQVAEFVRLEGPLALEPLMEHIQFPLLRKGMTMLIDNRPVEETRETLLLDVEITCREQMDYVRVLESAGGFAPTMGIIGAVIGLIHTVHTVHDPVAVGQGVAGAFSATLFGVALANLFLLPMAGKMRQRSRDGWFRSMLIIQGILAIYAGENPRLLQDKLNGFLVENTSGRLEQPQAARQSYPDDDNGFVPHELAWEG